MENQARLAKIQARIASAQQAETRNEILRERAAQEEKNALDSLKEEFGVADVDEAMKLSRELQERLDETFAQLEAALDELERRG